MFHSPRARLVVAFLAGAGLFGIATAVDASIPDSNGLIHGCYSKTTGALRVIDTAKNQKCGTAELALSWNQRGPKGMRGASGATGITGMQGPTGTRGSTGPTGTFSTANPTVIDTTVPVTGYTTFAYAYCPTGTHIYTGGYIFGHNVSFRVPIDVPVFASSQPSGEDGWEVELFVDNPPPDGHVDVYAVCA
jgi:hypothetical protein